MAIVTKSLAEAAHEGHLTSDDIDIKLLDEKIESSSKITEPDLLLVLGGPYLRLQGFPPWQIRLTEIFHQPSPAWLPSPDLTYQHLWDAMTSYQGSEQRIGK